MHLLDSWRTVNRSCGRHWQWSWRDMNAMINAMPARARAKPNHLDGVGSWTSFKRNFFLVQCRFYKSVLRTTMGLNSCCRGRSCRSPNTTMCTWRNLLLEYTFAVVCGGVVQVNRLRVPRSGWLRAQRAESARGSRERRTARVRGSPLLWQIV